MYVCICNAITDKQIRKAAAGGQKNLWQLQSELGVASGCGSCKDSVAEILSEERRQSQRGEPVLYRPAVAQALR